MVRFAKFAVLAVILLLAAALLYGLGGYLDARGDSEALRERADHLIAEGRGPEALGPGRAADLLMVQDPGFQKHGGVDFTTPGAGLTTVTQSLSKRLAFKDFKPGVRKIRQTGYALGLEGQLTKNQIYALWLNTLEMGNGPDGWMTGFFRASQSIYQKEPAALSDGEFRSLVAVLIAPVRYDLRNPSDDLHERIRRIERLTSGACTPSDHGDVWLEGCA
ncbi:glycosyl transferase [Amorphus sp. 3PC139-8]